MIFFIQQRSSNGDDDHGEISWLIDGEQGWYGAGDGPWTIHFHVINDNDTQQDGEAHCVLIMNGVSSESIVHVSVPAHSQNEYTTIIENHQQPSSRNTELTIIIYKSPVV
jgi:hypothetical protein